MQLKGLNLLGFDTSGEGKNTFQALDPATGQKMDPVFTEATTSEVAEAVNKAKAAFEPYRLKSNEERASFLEAIAEEILNLGEELIKRCMAETALPEARLTGERGRTMGQLKLFASVVREGSWVDARIDTAMPDRQPLPRPDVRQVQIPLGPVGIFGASNFPLAFSVAGGDTASALAAGCPVVVKGHPLHPGTSELVGQAIVAAAKKTGMPEGVFSLVQGTSVEVGMAIVKHPSITAIGFTGSFRGGKAIFDAANQRETPIPVYAEMGSTNPVFILPGAAKERGEAIAQGMVGSLTLGVGQFCTNPGLMITTRSPEVEALLSKMSAIASETPSGVMLGTGIKQGYLSGVKTLTESAGVSLLGAGKGGEDGNRVQARIFSTDADTFASNKHLSEEVFGPTTVNVSTSGKSEMLKIAEELEGHLTATIQGTPQDLEEYADLIRILERKVGRIIFNGYPTGVEVCHAMVHGGPFPATTAPGTTSVGTAAIKRFVRPVCYQDFPQKALPLSLQDHNPLKLWRLVNGELKK